MRISIVIGLALSGAIAGAAPAAGDSICDAMQIHNPDRFDEGFQTALHDCRQAEVDAERERQHQQYRQQTEDWIRRDGERLDDAMRQLNFRQFDGR